MIEDYVDDYVEPVKITPEKKTSAKFLEKFRTLPADYRAAYFSLVEEKINPSKAQSSQAAPAEILAFDHQAFQSMTVLYSKFRELSADEQRAHYQALLSEEHIYPKTKERQPSALEQDRAARFKLMSDQDIADFYDALEEFYQSIDPGKIETSSRLSLTDKAEIMKSLTNRELIELLHSLDLIKDEYRKSNPIKNRTDQTAEAVLANFFKKQPKPDARS